MLSKTALNALITHNGYLNNKWVSSLNEVTQIGKLVFKNPPVYHPSSGVLEDQNFEVEISERYLRALHNPKCSCEIEHSVFEIVGTTYVNGQFKLSNELCQYCNKIECIG